MADEKKEEMTLAKASNISDWVEGYYGDDAIDYSKANKLRHIIRTSQFAAVAFMVSKNTKQAHTDFFESNYTALDLTYAKATSLIIRLLSIKYGEDRPLTKADFQKCGGADLFKGRPNFDEICNDYIGAGGMVEQAEVSFPKPDPKELLEPGETLDDYKLLPDSEKNRRVGLKMALLYGSFVKDIEAVAADHAQLVKLSGSKSGVLEAKDVMELLDKATDKGSKMQREWKGKKSAIDFTIRDDIEKTYELGYDLAKQTGKVAALGGVAAASLGAVVGGVFWPAFLLIPAYAIAKKWLPDWTKSLGAMWGHVEKSIGNRFKRQRYDSYYHYMVSFMETGGKPKLRFKDRFFLTPGVIKTLKKGAKSGAVTSTFEGTDGEVHESELFRAKRTLEQTSFSNLLNYDDADKLVPADKQALLFSGVDQIEKSKASISQFSDLANKYNTWKDGLPRDSKHGFPIKFGDKLDECIVQLIFETPMEDIKYFPDTVEKAFSDEGAIVGVIKETDPAHPVLPKIARLKAFAKKEIVGLNDSWRDKTLHDFIERDGLAKLGDAEMTGFIDASDPNLTQALEWIKALERNPSKEKEKEIIIAGFPDKTLKDINDAIGDIVNKEDRKRCNDFLQDQLKIIFYNGFREDAKATYDALTGSAFAGKMVDISKFFDKSAEMTYENIDTMDFSQLVYDVTGETKISPPEVGNYLRIKLGQTAREKFLVHLDKSRAVFSTDLKELTTFLQKVNNCSFLNEQQKIEISTKAKGYVSTAFDKYIKDMSADFLGSYDSKAINNFIDSEYISGGFKTLFDTDKSAEVTEVKEKLSFLRRLNSAHQNLGFNGYTMSATDQQIIGMVLLRDSSKNFDTVKIRAADNSLVDFLTNKLNPSYKYGDFTSISMANLQAAITSSDSPYGDIVKKLDILKTGAMKDGECDDLDRYAALVALKNRSIVEFRKCLAKLVSDKCGDTLANTWLKSAEGKQFYGKAIDVWKNGVFKDIDDELGKIITKSTTDVALANNLYKTGVTQGLMMEIDRYDGSSYTMELATERGLGA